MRCLALLTLALVIGSPPISAEDAPKPAPEAGAKAGRYAIRVGRILTMAGTPIERGTILVANGKIEAVGPTAEVKIPDGYEIVDRPDGWALPGFIEVHSHAGASDLHDMAYPTNPDMRADDNVVPDNNLLRMARARGVTTCLTIPGSGTNMGGFGVLVKTGGKTPEEAILRFPGALKVAQAGNPERRAGGLGSSRIGMTHNIRETIKKGLAYGRAWMAYEKGEAKTPPAIDQRYENFRGIAKGEIPVIVHTQNTMVLQSTIRLFHDELGVDCILSHASFDAYRNAPLAAKRGIPVNVGPRMVLYNSRDGRIHGLGAEWFKGGVKSLTINTDAPVVPQEDLVTQAAVAVRFGLPEDVALRGITIECAKQLKIDHRIGSLEVGKDADIVIHSGPPLDLRTRILAVFVNGKPVLGEGIVPPERDAGPTLLDDHPDHD